MDIFLIFSNMMVFCMFSLESPHRDDSNEYTQYTIFNINQSAEGAGGLGIIRGHKVGESE